MDREEMLRLLKQGVDPLDLSIWKWEDIRDGTGKNEGSRNCALCEVHPRCFGCPIREETYHVDCRGTPYDMVRCLPKDVEIPKESTEKELAFLLDLKWKLEMKQK